MSPLEQKILQKQAIEILNGNKSIPVEHMTWNRRYRTCMEKINSNDILQVAHGMRIIIESQKQLSFGERLLYDMGMKKLKHFGIIPD